MGKLFACHFERRDSVRMMNGCAGRIYGIALQMYQQAFFEKRYIKTVSEQKKWKDSMAAVRRQGSAGYLPLAGIPDVETAWTGCEIDALILKFNRIIPDHPESPEDLICLLCTYHLFHGIKIPHFEKLSSFKTLYKSGEIGRYLKFCRYGLREDAD